MVRIKSLRIYLALCLILNLFIYQVDIVGTYPESLFGNNELLIFMKLPPKIQYLRQIQEDILYRLLRSLYRLWNQNVIIFYKKIRFVQLNGELSILIRYSENKTSIVSIYINDFLLTLHKIDTLEVLKKSLSKEYNTKDLGKVKTIIRW